MKLKADIITEDRCWNTISKIHIKNVIQLVISNYNNLSKININLSILLTNTGKLQYLNNEFRSKDKSTNVLSFPQDNTKKWVINKKFIPNSYLYLGDIAFAYGVISDEANTYKKDFINHFTHLLIHSILHLLGYDHIDEEESREMENIEIDILKYYNIANPYIID